MTAAVPTQHAPWTSDPLNPSDGRAWDLVVLGGGTAGIVAARTAASLGADVLMVSDVRPGGDCLWTGCVPSKALLAAGKVAHGARAAADYGIGVSGVEVDFGAVMGRVRRVIGEVEPADSPETLRAAGVRLAHAYGRLTSPDTVELSTGERIRFRHAILATGSAPHLPTIPGLEAAEPLTSDTFWELRERPARLVVLGGGSIGCELAQAMARLGSAVTVLEPAAAVLPREDPAAADIVRAALAADGVDIRTGTAAASVERNGGGLVVTTDAGERIAGDRVLVAIGRRPLTRDIGAEEAGVELNESGHVRVDARLATSNPRIWAAGDVTGHPAFTHVAGVHGSTAASNAVLGLRRRAEVRHIPRVTFTDPELAAFGDATDADSVELTHDEVDRAIADGTTTGLTRLTLDRRRRITGATIVSPRAGELLGEVIVAARSRLTASDLASTMHAYPAYSDAVWKPAIAVVREQLAGAAAARVTSGLAAWQRRRHRPDDATPPTPSPR